jgi:hypothetical protein
MMIIFLQLLFPDKPANVRLSYRDFLNAIDSGKVSRIVIFNDRIIGEFRIEGTKEEEALTHAPGTPWRVRVPSMNDSSTAIYCSRIPDLPDPELCQN